MEYILIIIVFGFSQNSVAINSISNFTKERCEAAKQDFYQQAGATNNHAYCIVGKY